MKRSSTESCESGAVGSSRIRSRGDTANALASSRRWRRATLSDETRSSRWPRKWTSSSSERIAFVASGSRRRRCSSPTATRMFSATVMSGSSAGCWWTIAIPRSCATAGVRLSTRRAVEDDRAAVGRRRARGDVHQRRLAGAVLPEQGVHLAREHVERDVGERCDRVVVLGDAEHRQRRLHGGPAVRGRRVDGGFVDHDERSRSRGVARGGRAAAARNSCVVPTSSPAWPAPAADSSAER